MQHRIYRLNNKLTIFGLEINDIAVAAFGYFLANGVVNALLDSRINILIIVGVTFLITRIWISIKDTVPDKFFIHAVMWLAERNRYYATSDFEPTPSVIDVNAVELQAITPKRRRKHAR